MPDDTAAFPILNDADLALLESLGTRHNVSAGQYLIRQGDESYSFYAVLSGVVDIVVESGASENLIVRYDAGRFIGELGLLTAQRAFVSARVVESGEVVALSRQAIRHVIATNPRLSDTLLTAFVARHDRLLTSAADAVRVVGSRFLPEAQHIREYLTRSRVPHVWLDPDGDASVDGLLRQFGVGPSELPVVFASGSVLRQATVGALAEYLGMTLASIPFRSFDLIVVGAGPAGLAAGVYGASEGLRTLVVETSAVGGQAGTSSRIENYLGFPTGISGADLIERALVQAEKFGAFLSSPCAVTSLREEQGHLVVRLSDGTDVAGRAVIAASGARYRRLEADHLAEFEGRGVFYAASELEARLCANSPVMVVGGGNSAGQAALFLAESCSSVHLVIRGPDLGKSMSRYLVDRIEAHPGIQVNLNTRVISLEGSPSLSAVRVAAVSGETTIPCAGLFSLIGAEPNSEWLCGCAALDEDGFVLTDLQLDEAHLDDTWRASRRRPLPFETSRPGLFAVGDLRSGSMKRVAAAVGEGSSAVRSVHQYLAFAHEASPAGA